MSCIKLHRTRASRTRFLPCRLPQPWPRRGLQVFLYVRLSRRRRFQWREDHQVPGLYSRSMCCVTQGHDRIMHVVGIMPFQCAVNIFYLLSPFLGEHHRSSMCLMCRPHPLVRKRVSLASHTLHRERKGLVTLQLPSCRRGMQYRPLRLGNKMLTSAKHVVT